MIMLQSLMVTFLMAYFLCSEANMLIIPFMLLVSLTKFSVTLSSSLELFDAWGYMPVYQILMMMMILFSSGVSLLGSYDNFFTEKSKSLNMLIMSIMFSSMMMLILSNPIMVYMIFELASIPIFIIIMGWGYQPEKMKAAYMMLMYTTLSAVPLLTMLLSKLALSNSTNFYMLTTSSLVNNSLMGSLMSLSIFLSFMVKMPLYGFHFWLPMAHVEAPVYASMILASVLLKLGGIGLLRFYGTVYSFYILDLFSILSLWGSMLVGFTCLTTTDLKKVIAYTSVAHMAFSIILWSMSSSAWMLPYIITLITHAFSSSGLFYSAHIMYKDSNSRLIMMNSGSMSKDKSFTFYWLLLVMASAGAPPSINLLSEIISLALISMTFMPLLIVVIMMIMLMSGTHFLMYSSISQSIKTWEESNLLNNCTVMDYFMLILHMTIIIITPFMITYITL